MNLNQNIGVLSSDALSKILFFAVFKTYLAWKEGEKEKIIYAIEIVSPQEWKLVWLFPKHTFSNLRMEEQKVMHLNLKAEMGLNIVFQVLNPRKIFDWTHQRDQKICNTQISANVFYVPKPEHIWIKG